jgi:hypothetical protein
MSGVVAEYRTIDSDSSAETIHRSGGVRTYRTAEAQIAPVAGRCYPAIARITAEMEPPDTHIPSERR